MDTQRILERLDLCDKELKKIREELGLSARCVELFRENQALREQLSDRQQPVLTISETDGDTVLDTALDDTAIPEELNHISAIEVDEMIQEPAPLENNAQELKELLPYPPATQKTIKKAKEKREFIGLDKLALKLISSLGVLVLIIGALTAFYLSADVNIMYVGILAVGICLLIGGEVLNRKWKGVFSLALTAGGTSFLFLSTTIGYLGFKNLSLTYSIIVYIIAAALSFYLSIRYKSQVIAVFSIVGAYLPITLLSPSITYGAFIFLIVYFIFLNVFVLLFSIGNNWRTLICVGFLFSFISELCYFEITGDVLLPVISCFIAFLLYQIIPLYADSFHFTKNKIINKPYFKYIDVVVMTLNTFLRMIWLIYILKYTYYYTYTVYEDYSYLVPVGMAIVSIPLSVLANKRHIVFRILLFIQSVVMIFLSVPFVLENSDWKSLAWMAEAFLLLSYGIIKSKERFSIAGAAIGAIASLSVLALLFNASFYGKPVMITLILYMLLSAFLVLEFVYCKNDRSQFYNSVATWFTVFTCVCLALYLLFYAPAVLTHFSMIHSHSSDDIYSTLWYFLSVIAVFGISHLISNLKILNFGNSYIKITGHIIGGFNFFRMILFTLNIYSFSIRFPLISKTHPELNILSILIFFTAHIISILWLHHLTKQRGIAFHAVSVAILFLTTSGMLARSDLGFSNLLYTFLFVLFGLIWIIYGFRVNLLPTRRIGLTFTLISVAKLFIVDTWNQSALMRTISYCVLGVFLLVISFVYQYFEKKLKNGVNKQKENMAENEQNNL